MNKNKLTAVAQKLYDHNIKLVPVREKLPYMMDWIKGLTLDTVATEIINDNCTGFGIVCGIENVECIDIDVKNNYNAISQFKELIETKYSHLIPCFNIETTPSGGMHVWYRCDAKVSGNKKLAKNSNGEAFIETRGRGGQFVCFPSEGYQAITWDGEELDDVVISEHLMPDSERNSLFADIVKLGVTKEATRELPVAVKKDVTVFQKSPFQDFNDRYNFASALESNGWRFNSQNADWIHYTRPGKDSGVSASLSKSSNRLYMFTSSTEFNPDTLVSASEFVIKTEYNGDAKAFYNDIKGDYGELKPQISQQILKTALLNIQGGTDLIQEPPANLLPEHKQVYKQRVQELTNEHRFGIFWQASQRNNREVIEIDRTRLYEVMGDLGYRRYNGSVIRLITNPHCPEAGERFVYYTNTSKALSHLKEYTAESDGTVIRNAVDSFWEKHAKHIFENLGNIDKNDFINDDIYTWWRFFKNGALMVGRDGVQIIPYKDLPQGFIFLDRYFDFELNPDHDASLKCDSYEVDPNTNTKRYMPLGKFRHFIERACLSPKYALQCAAWMVHDYKLSTSAYLVGLLERSSEINGGAGKGLFMKAVSMLTNVCDVDASAVGKRLNAELFQVWDSENRIISLNDCPKGIELSDFKEMITGSTVAKKLYQNMDKLPFELSPKLTFNTNHSYSAKDPALKRRIRVIEFSPYFNHERSVNTYISKEYGLGTPIKGNFPDRNPHRLNNDFTKPIGQIHCWTDYDWNDFYWTIAFNVQKFLQNDLVLEDLKMSVESQIRRFIATFNDSIYEYVEYAYKYFQSTRTNDDFIGYYKAWCERNNILPIYRISNPRLIEAFKMYAEIKGDRFESDAVTASGARNGKRVLVSEENKILEEEDVLNAIRNQSKSKDDWDEEYNGDLPF